MIRLNSKGVVHRPLLVPAGNMNALWTKLVQVMPYGKDVLPQSEVESNILIYLDGQSSRAHTQAD